MGWTAAVFPMPAPFNPLQPDMAIPGLARELVANPEGHPSTSGAKTSPRGSPAITSQSTEASMTEHESSPPADAVAPGQAPAATRGLRYAVDIAFCIDVTGSMTPILDRVKDNALRFYDDVQKNLTEKGKNVDELRVRVIAFRDFKADGAAALQESPFFRLPEEQAGFAEFVRGLVPEGGGDAPESGLEAVALAVNSSWTTSGDRRRQVIVVWTDSPAQPLTGEPAPAPYTEKVPKDFSALTDLWENEQGVMGASSKRLIIFAPDGPGWTDISGVWENVVHHPSKAGEGLSEVDYGTIIDSIANSV